MGEIYGADAHRRNDSFRMNAVRIVLNPA